MASDSDSLLYLSFNCTPTPECGFKESKMMVPVALSRSRLQLPILKIRQGALVHCVVADVGPFWFAVHWVDGRQVLCSLGDVSPCPLCACFPARVIGCTLALLRLSGVSRLFLLEVSPIAWSNFESRCRMGAIDMSGGVSVEISRPRARGALRIEARESVSLNECWKDADFHLLAGWAVLYGLPLPSAGETSTQFVARTLSILCDRAAVALEKVRK